MTVKRGRKLTRQEKAEKYLQDKEDFSRAWSELKKALREAMEPVFKILRAGLGGGHGKD